MTKLPSKQQTALPELPIGILEQRADSIYNIEQANTVNQIVNNVPVRKALPSDQFFNLFVKNEETYEGNSFDMDSDRIFEYTVDYIRGRFSNFTMEDIEEIMSLPAVFLPEINNQSDIPEGYLGRLVEVSVSREQSKFYFKKERTISVQFVEENREELMIDDWELSRTHWAIKRGDLKEVIDRISRDEYSESVM